MLNILENRIIKSYDQEKAKILQRFFKTGQGEYGEGDIFLGISVPDQRKIAMDFIDLRPEDIKKLLDSKIHEKRLIGLLILVEKFKKTKNKDIYDFYLENKNSVNNWDLVDLTADKIVGTYLINKNKDILYNLAKSDNLWDRRIAIVSTFAFIKNDKFEDCLKISSILLNDKHDLIHKAVGWMLREIGKRDERILKSFLDGNYKKMPRTMLRYSIERLNKSDRKKYLNKKL